VLEEGVQSKPADRRRFPRQPVSDVTARIQMFVDVEVLDISLHGALLSCECPLGVGDRAQIRLVLDHQPFVSWASVVRVAVDRGRAGYPAVGVAFVSQDDERMAPLRRFLAQS
jgi:PilZ domain